MYDDYYTTLGEVERQEGNNDIDEENENQLGTLFLFSLGLRTLSAFRSRLSHGACSVSHDAF